MKTTRIEWLDGVKGIACLLIFLHHFLLVFYPAVHYGSSVPSWLNNIDTALSQSTLSVFTNGNFLVAVFCMISGIVISLQVMTMTDPTKLAEMVVKRYLRLMLPLLPVGILINLMLRFGLFSHLDVAAYTQSPWASQYYTWTFGLRRTFKSAFVDTWFYGDDTLSTAFWMLSELFCGTFVSILLSVLTWKYRKKAHLIYLLLIIFIFDRGDITIAFVFGTLLATIFTNQKQGKHTAFVGLPALIVGLFLGGYPSGVLPTNYYHYFSKITFWDLHALGAFLTLYGLGNCSGIQHYLSLRIWKWLGKISYSVYLLHIPLLFSLSTSAFLLMKAQMSYGWAVLISFITSALVLIAAAWIYNRVVEQTCVSVQQRIMKFLE